MKFMNSTKKYNRTHEYYQKETKNLNELKQISKSQTHSKVPFGWDENKKDGK